MSSPTRLLTSSDLDFGHSLSRLAGWNQTRRDWERFLSLAPDGCFLAQCEENPAGTATTTTHGDTIAWIGMVLVHPDFRRRGIGTDLLRRAIAHLREERGIPCIGLDATPEGRPLYEGLGFRAGWGLRRWVRETAESGRVGGAGANIAPAPPLPERRSLELDREVFGADRSRLLASLAAGSFATEQLDDGSFGLMREGERADYLGPVTAASVEAGLALAAKLAGDRSRDRTLFWDLPDPNLPAARLAEQLGFRPVRVLTRMWLGEEIPSSDPARMFGIAEPGLG